MKTFKIVNPSIPEHITVVNGNEYEYQFMILSDGRLVINDGSDDPFVKYPLEKFDDWALSKEDSIAIAQYLYDRIIGQKKTIKKLPSCGIARSKKSIKNRDND